MLNKSSLHRNGGDNPDAAWLRALFGELRRNGSELWSRLAYDQMAVLGYSVGAQMVSRSPAATVPLQEEGNVNFVLGRQIGIEAFTGMMSS